MSIDRFAGILSEGVDAVMIAGRAPMMVPATDRAIPGPKGHPRTRAMASALTAAPPSDPTNHPVFVAWPE